MRKKMAFIALILCFVCANGVSAHEDGDEHEGASPPKCRCNMDRSTRAGSRKVEVPARCHNCGMDRTAFAASRVLVTFTDGTTVGTCSINCAYDEVSKSSSKKIKNIKVADYTGKKLIDAKKAIWVIGGKKNGVMTATAKWAFEEKAGAERFIKENGGKIATFEEAWKAAAQ